MPRPAKPSRSPAPAKAPAPGRSRPRPSPPRRGRPPDLSGRPKRSGTSFKSTAEFAAWLDGFARWQRVPISVLLEHAVVHHAWYLGYKKKPPER